MVTKVSPPPSGEVGFGQGVDLPGTMRADLCCTGQARPLRSARCDHAGLHRAPLIGQLLDGDSSADRVAAVTPAGVGLDRLVQGSDDPGAISSGSRLGGLVPVRRWRVGRSGCQFGVGYQDPVSSPCHLTSSTNRRGSSVRVLPRGRWAPPPSAAPRPTGLRLGLRPSCSALRAARSSSAMVRTNLRSLFRVVVRWMLSAAIRIRPQPNMASAPTAPHAGFRTPMASAAPRTA